MNQFRDARYPWQAARRSLARRRTTKERLHELLRDDPKLSVEYLSKNLGCPQSYARIWRNNFFAPGYEPQD